MTSSDDLVLGAPAEPEPLGQLFGSVFDLAGEAALRTPEEVRARLRQIAASAARPADEPGPAAAEWDVDRAVSALSQEHYRSLVRLAALLVRDVATAEEVVQDSFVAMHGGWSRIRDTDLPRLARSASCVKPS